MATDSKTKRNSPTKPRPSPADWKNSANNSAGETMRFTILLLIVTAPLRADDLQDLIDPPAKKLLESGKSIGFVVGVRINGKNRVFGYGNVKVAGGGKTPDGETLFEIGSITKAFTGVLLADAIRRGEMTLDA